MESQQPAVPASPYVTDVDDSNLEQNVLMGSRQAPIVVDFWTAWCKPCQIRMPVLAPVADGNLAEAERRLLADDPAGAMDLLMQARADDPANPLVAATIADLQAAQGDLEAAERTLEERPTEAQAKPEITRLRGRLFFERIAQDTEAAETQTDHLAATPDRCEARFQMAIHQIRAGDVEGAMEGLLQMLQQDRAFGDNAARHALQRSLEMLGDDPAVGRFRTRMFALLD